MQLESLCPLLQVYDMPTSITFYRDVLGFEIVSTSRPGIDVGWAWLRSGSAEVMLNTAYDEGTRPPAPDPARLAAHADTILYIGCPDVDAAYTCLRSRGINLDPPVVASYGMKQLYVTDPDGFGVCFQWRTGGTTVGGG